MRTVTRRLGLGLPTLLLAFGLAACGNGGEADGRAGAAGGQQEMREAELAFYDCMRGEGVDVKDPDPSANGINITGLDMKDPKTKAAMEQCRKLLPGGGDAPEIDADGLEALRTFVGCMRDKGIDMPDPGSDGSLRLPEGVDPQSTQFQGAMEECREHMKGQRMIVRGGGQSGQ
ncbi:hypothetical protein SacmaDRAFT_0181 [Saccharomonospora marina XMU15]|uniref:Lipoprotein n=1 Tax=Saccharomonospora marina XMU15 TaxID=882083 RepID=H5WZ92_9PSEU|nr:hypothetical protein SacmaDRAFT_0181 [Saccharomonospora marina XMU15]